MILREFKGKSIIAFPSDYVILDIETTGYDPKYNNIIEIGLLRIRADKITDSYNTFINPDYLIDEYIQELTGITNEDLKNAPSFSDVESDILSFIGNDIILGHNVNYDINFVYDNCCNGKLTNDFVDTLRMSRKLIPTLEHHRLIDMMNFYGIETEKLHRSIADCTATFELYLRIKNDIENYDDFINSFKRKSHSGTHVNANDIVAEVSEFDEDHPLFNKYVVFTGTLDLFIRAKAMQIVANFGGHCQNSVTKQTNYLVLGNNDYCKSIKDGKSSKQKKAEALKLKGQDIEIITENIFYELIIQQ